MLLASTSDLVRLITGAAASIEAHVEWVDWQSGPTFSPGRTNTVITTATTTTIVASPAASTQRQVKVLLIRNDHASTSCDVTVFHTDGTTQSDVFKATLAAGESLAYDGVWHHYSASGIEYVYDTATPQTDYFIRAASDRTLTSTTAEQAMFNVPTNGRITLLSGVYKFDWQGIITGMSATSGNARLDILGAGNAVLANIVWSVRGLDNSSANTIADDDAAYYQVDTSAASAVAAGTGTALRFKADGSFEVTTGGTLQPALALVTAAAAIVEQGSHFTLRRLGDVGVTHYGSWD